MLLLLLLTFPFPADAPPEPDAGPPRGLFANELGVSAEAVGFPVAAAAELDNGKGNLLLKLHIVQSRVFLQRQIWIVNYFVRKFIGKSP